MYFPMMKSFERIQNFLNDIHNLVICIGSNDDGKRSPECFGSLPSNNKNSIIKRCPKCNEVRRKIQKTKSQNIQLRKKSKSYRHNARTKQNKRLKTKVSYKL